MGLNSKRNLSILFSDSVLFTNAMTYLSVATVITYFLITLEASTFQISLANVLVSVGTFVSQPYFAKKAAALPLKSKYFSIVLIIQRLFLLSSIIAIPKLIKISNSLTVIVFLISWGIFNFFVGSYSVFYMALLSKIADNSLIGRLRGFSGAAGNIIALGSAYSVGLLLKQVQFPYNYTIIFLIGAFLLFLDALVFWFIQEPSENIKTTSISHLQYLKDITDTLRNDKHFVKLITGCTLLVISNISLVYYTLYAIRRFNARADEVALFMSITVIVNIFGNILFGVLADRYNHRLIMIISSVCGVVAGIIILSLYSMYAVYAAFVFSNLCSCGFMLSGSILIMRCSPQAKIPTYFLIYNIIALAISSILTVISSFIIDTFSFSPLFALTGSAALGSLLIFTCCKSTIEE